MKSRIRFHFALVLLKFLLVPASATDVELAEGSVPMTGMIIKEIIPRLRI